MFQKIHKLHEEFSNYIYHFLLWNQYQYPCIVAYIMWAHGLGCRCLIKELAPTSQAKEIVFGCKFQDYVNTYCLCYFLELFGTYYCMKNNFFYVQHWTTFVFVGTNKGLVLVTFVTLNSF
jgi:hypothetical protein